MKKLLLFLLVCIPPTISHAQPLITDNLNVQLGDNYYRALWDTTGAGLGSIGANQTWNYNLVQSLPGDTMETVAPSYFPFGSLFPQSNVAQFRGGNTAIFFGTSTTDFQYYGGVRNNESEILANPLAIMVYPFTYNSFFADAFSGTYTRGSQQYKRTGLFTTSYNGYGTLIVNGVSTPNAIHLMSITYYSDSLIGSSSPPILDTVRTVTYIDANLDIVALMSKSHYSSINVNPAYFFTYKKLTTGIHQIGTAVPDKYLLKQNYPNPFNPTTKINFFVPLTGFISLKVYNSLGREVANLVNENLTAGEYDYDFKADNLTSGIYFYTLQAGEFLESKKMILMK